MTLNFAFLAILCYCDLGSFTAYNFGDQLKEKQDKLISKGILKCVLIYIYMHDFKLPQFLMKETLCVIKQNRTLKKKYTKLLLCTRSCTHFVQGDVHILCKVMYVFCILVSIHKRIILWPLTWQHSFSQKKFKPSVSSNTCTIFNDWYRIISVYQYQYVTFPATLGSLLSGTFLQTLPDLVTPLKGHSLSPRGCPAMRSVPSERFRDWYCEKTVEAS